MLTSSIQNSPPHVTPAKQSNVSSKYDRNTKHRRKVSLITSFQCMRQTPDSSKLRLQRVMSVMLRIYIWNYYWGSESPDIYNFNSIYFLKSCKKISQHEQLILQVIDALCFTHVLINTSLIILRQLG